MRDQLTQKLKAEGQEVHPHSIVLLRDTFQKFPNRYLVYQDEAWDCLFFPNYKDNPNNEDFIKGHLSSELKIEKENISLKYLTQRIHQKYSVTHQEYRVYSHKFYLTSISSYPEKMRADSFEQDGRQYYWKTIDELRRDPDVQKKNSDILRFVTELS